MRLAAKRTNIISSQEQKPAPQTARPANEYSYDFYTHGVTQGLLTRFLQCPEKHRLATIEGLSPLRTGGALAFGSLVHDTLDVIYSSVATALDKGEKVTLDSAVDVMRQSLREAQAKDNDSLSKNLLNTEQYQQQMEVNYGLAEVIIRNYLHRWKNDTTRYQWEALELEFNVPYVYYDTGESIPVRGKMDGIFRTGQPPKLWLFETKTKSRIEEEAIVDTMTLNMQVCLYLWCMEKLYGERPVGVVYNLLRKPQLRQGKNETLKSFLEKVDKDIAVRPDFYFIRYNVSFDRDDMEKWEKDFKGLMLQLRSWQRGDWHYRNGSSCDTKYGTCEFLNYCSRGETTYLQRRQMPFPELPGTHTIGD